jgi:hypothetical protein
MPLLSILNMVKIYSSIEMREQCELSNILADTL